MINLVQWTEQTTFGRTQNKEVKYGSFGERGEKNIPQDFFYSLI
jgi:hypothetical protein